MQAHLTEVHCERLSVCERWFREHHLDNVVSEQGSSEVDDLLDDFTPLGATDDEMSAYALKLIALVAEARRALSGVRVTDSSAKSLRAIGIEIEKTAEAEAVFETVAKRQAARSRAASLYDTSAIASLVRSGPLHEREVTRQEARIAAETDLRAQCSFIDAEIDAAEEALAGFVRPQGLWATLAALGTFAFLGMVLPLVIMSFRPVPDSATIRVALVIAFCAGLIALMGVLVWTAVQTTRSTDGRDRGSSR